MAANYMGEMGGVSRASKREHEVRGPKSEARVWETEVGRLALME